jgi:hypothetical protein
MISESKLQHLAYKAAEISGATERTPEVRIRYIHTPNKNSIKYVYGYKVIDLEISDWAAEMPEDVFVSMMVQFFDTVINLNDPPMPDDVKAWVDANRYKWTGVSA